MKQAVLAMYSDVADGLDDQEQYPFFLLNAPGGAETKGGQGAALPKLLSMFPKTLLTLAAFSRWWLFFIGDLQRTRRKLDRVGAMTFFLFLEINRTLREN